MLQRLARDTLIYGAATFLVRGIQILLIPVYTRLLLPEEYGVLDMVVVFGALVNLIVALEISQGAARFLADAATESERQSYVATAVTFSLAAYALFAVAVWIFVLPLSYLLFDSDRWAGALRVAAVFLAVNGVFVLIQDLLRWHLRPQAYALASLAFVIPNAGLGIYLVAVADYGIYGVLGGQLAGALLGAASAAVALRDKLGLKPDYERLSRMLVYSIPLVLSGAAVFANQFIDRIMIKEILGIDHLGVYGVAARFASVVALLTIGLQAALMPLVFRNFRDPHTADALSRVFRYYLTFMVFLIGFISLYADEIFSVLVGEKFWAGSKILPVLAMASFFANLYIFFPGLFLGKRTLSVAAINVTAATVNLLLNLYFLPVFGITAAAVAVTAASAIAFSGYVILGQRYFAVTFPVKSFFSALILLGLMMLFGSWLNCRVIPFEIFNIVSKTAIWGSTFLLATYLCLSPEDRTLVFSGIYNLWMKKSFGER
jgi:O-antigen/teichoic acid export membrane protein